MNITKIAIFILTGLVISCTQNSKNTNEWNEVTRVHKTVDNITYYFDSKISIERRNAAIKECQQSVIENLALINEESFTHQMDVEFLASRDEMLKFAGMSAQGLAYPERDTFFSLLKDEGSPIKHEIMHMITMYKWGIPSHSSTWMNEGLATYSGGLCYDYTPEEIYKYLLQSHKVISMENLATDFYSNPDIIAYTQSAFVCKYLIDNYGLEKFQLLWKDGFKEMPSIYNFTAIELETAIQQQVNSNFPNDIDFDWELFDKGC